MLAWMLIFALVFGFTTQQTSTGAHTRWNRMPVHWALYLESAPPGLRDELAFSVEDALATWEGVAGANIRFSGGLVGGSSAVDVIRFEHDWEWDDEVLALTFVLSNLDGDIHRYETLVNGGVAWSGPEAHDLQSVMVHELGHALGIDHSDERRAVMFGTIERGEIRRELHDDDLDAARFLYGGAATGAALHCASGAGAPGSVAALPLLLFLLARRRRRTREVRDDPPIVPRPLRRCLLAALVVLSSWSAPALGASVDGPVSLVQLVRASRSAVRGEVIAREPVRRRGLLHTRYTIRVDEQLLGADEGDTVTVTLPGGVDGDLVVRASGVPLWEEGDEVVVFLRDGGRPSLRGLFTVDRGDLRDPLGHRTDGFPRALPELRRAVHALEPPEPDTGP